MTIKMLAVDLDGTLLTSTNTIASETKRMLTIARKSGIKIVLASGRPLSGILQYADELGLEGDDQFATVFNGGVAQSYSGHVLFSHEQNYHDFETMIRLQRLADINLHFETTEAFYTLDRDINVQMGINASTTNNRILVRDKKEIPKDFTYIKCEYTGSTEEVSRFWNRIPDWVEKQYNVVRSAENIVEFNNPSASKGLALAELADRLGFEENEVMLFGDQGNDISMFSNPNFFKVAMGNAIDEIKERADYVTDDNNHNGIAKALKKFVL
ncbi:Cof-type HAD-IIB family hydrolase [Lactobacillus psittaci]|nr:Cof-type HAD-IIB family hydrolase [Lactobacillus psittaci]